jgi:hypothetical protein
MHGKGEKYSQNFSCGTQREETTWGMEGNIKVNLEEIGCDDVGQDMAQWVSSCEHGNEPL